ncbi:MAG TPA: BREX-1 system adenine-specific DNA-methyltransferase PglX, partial [Bacillota bacterium]|nr:BREX-1 system adenine-specific DNA-methyltransferase PglX [Bacillota bacterium]
LGDWMELLLPGKMLEPGGIIDRIISNEGLTKSFEEGVEAIGWLYQFYMSEKKSVVGGLKNTAVKKEDLPAVTQLFTPRWIVEYMIENSLGKLYDEWQEQNGLAKEWPYYLKHTQSDKLLPNFKGNLEEMKFFDPACGSGHILVAAFDYFFEMYIEQGYRETEIPVIILEKNLYGCDIDKRATQIASFALYMKATEKDHRILKRSLVKTFHVMEIMESENLTDEEWDWIAPEVEEQFHLKNMVSQFANGKQFGSLIQPERLEYDCFITKINEAAQQPERDPIQSVIISNVASKLLPVLKQARLLSNQYDVVVTNPPYHNKFNPVLKDFMNQEYGDFKSDLYSAFIYRSMKMTKENGYSAFMTPFTWMFIGSYEGLRQFMIENGTLSSLVQLEYSAFEEATVPICTFVIHNQHINTVGEYIRLAALKGDQAAKVRAAVGTNCDYRYSFDSQNLGRISGAPIAYWATDSVMDCFLFEETFESMAPAKKGMDTNAESELYFRNWFEVDRNKIYGVGSLDKHHAKWFEINKGGGFRRWYGNRLDVIDYENDGYRLKNKRRKANIRNESFYFQESLTYGVVTSSKFSFRISDRHALFDQGGPNCFPSEEYIKFILALGNSKVIEYLLTFIAPTLNFTVGDINKLPIKRPEQETLRKIEKLCERNVAISKEDWNSYEVSWDFLKHPFVEGNLKDTSISDKFSIWKLKTKLHCSQLKRNEEELNAMFIKLYELENELTPDVMDEEMKLRPANRELDTKSFLSYFIGCLMGRYSLDVNGLIYAGGQWDQSIYKTFQPCCDGALTFTDEKVLPDQEDIYVRLQEFLTVIYGEETLQQNLTWIAGSIDQKIESVEKTIRHYFVKNFAKDHAQLYQNRPIYWQIDSGKENAMKTLLYVHRYTPQTMRLVLNHHLIPLLGQWRALTRGMEEEVNSRLFGCTEKKVKMSQLNRYRKRVEELERFQDQLQDFARQEIEMDTDDGVKVNYRKFTTILTPIKL